ncbi:beta-ketoacyl synthase N-terminal-like domain-containing protein, partial [Chromobacterium alticapitis]
MMNTIASVANHVCGFIAIPALEACRKTGILTRVSSEESFLAEELAREMGLSEATLGIVLRCLQLAGCAEIRETGRWQLSELSASFVAPQPDLMTLLSNPYGSADSVEALASCLELSARRWDAPAIAPLLDQMLTTLLLARVAHGEPAASDAQPPLLRERLSAFLAARHGTQDDEDAAAKDCAVLMRYAPILARLDGLLAGTARPEPDHGCLLDAIAAAMVRIALDACGDGRMDNLVLWHFGSEKRRAALSEAILRHLPRAPRVIAVEVSPSVEAGAGEPAPVTLSGDCLTPRDALRQLGEATSGRCLHIVNMPGRRAARSGEAPKLEAAFAAWADLGAAHEWLILEEHAASAAQHTLSAACSCLEQGLAALRELAELTLRSADDCLMLAAAAQLFPAPGPAQTLPQTEPLARLSLHRLQKRDYRIRPLQIDDLPAMTRLENLCWGSALAADEMTLLRRLRQFPSGQLALLQDDRLIGAMYTQRIAGEEDILAANALNILERHADDGLVIQLLAVNIDPDWQDRGLGDQLLEFMLQRCAVLDGVETVLAVTRGKDYPQHAPLPMSDYIKLRNPRGYLVDPVLRFHELHGAAIRRALPGYRPGDADNQEYGVLVGYDIRRRHRAEQASAASDCAETSPETIRAAVQEHIQALLPQAARFAPDRPLIEMGLDSASLLQLTEALTDRFRLKLGSAFFFEFNTSAKVVAELQARLETRRTAAAAQAPQTDAVSPEDADAVAIVGISLRLPGGIEDLDSLWRLLRDQECAVGRMPAARWRWPEDIRPETAHPGVDCAGTLDHIDRFDAECFRLSPAEAELIDPQQRILLELCWHCLEDAGYAPEQFAGSQTGVFVGASGVDYLRQLQQQPQVAPQYGLAKSAAILANRLSYFFDLQGPSLQIDTACSSSLVAIHQALQALRDGLCDQAVVAGIHVMTDPATTIAYYKAGMLSPTGRCHTFDAAADGYVRSEGAIAMLLKPLTQARRQGNHIYAVVRGAAVNHGGRAGGLTVPHPGRQADLLVEAYRRAKAPIRRLSYIEAHGTGTPLGDPIEVQGIKTAIRRLSEGDAAPASCGIGSIKTNLGHLEAAAGMAGMLKVILAMRHGVLPGNAGFVRLNPRIELDSCLYIAKQTQPWSAALAQNPLLAGVSSFGSGGTNAHIVLEAPPRQESAPRHPGLLLLPLSAASEPQLRQLAGDLIAKLSASPVEAASLCATMQLGRTPLACRLLFAAAQPSSLQGLLRDCDRSAIAAGGLLTAADIDLADPRHARWLRCGEAWLNGGQTDWGSLYDGALPPKLSLPGYPFLRGRHWLPAASADAARPHALALRDVSDSAGPCYAATLDASSFIVRDHVVRGRAVLPAAAQLELARAAACRGLNADDGAQIELLDTVFLRPAQADGALSLHARLRPDADRTMAFEIRGDDGTLYSQGRARLAGKAPPPDLPQTMWQGPAHGALASDECYATLSGMGLDYGPAYRA